MFPGANASVYRNEAGEPIGWDYPSSDDPYDPDDYLTHDADDDDDEVEVEWCDALARKGTGTGSCNRPLDSHGRCDRASDHI
jgi:hypothetical protein